MVRLKLMLHSTLDATGVLNMSALDEKERLSQAEIERRFQEAEGYPDEDEHGKRDGNAAWQTALPKSTDVPVPL